MSLPHFRGLSILLPIKPLIIAIPNPESITFFQRNYPHSFATCKTKRGGSKVEEKPAGIRLRQDPPEAGKLRRDRQGRREERRIAMRLYGEKTDLKFEISEK